ncbi:hypothetical protein [Burkholderia plantarii]|uniref:hypothetical protein n=1 Tax=Burkholderia plantarii TaxID=41899 RepID=UPI0006D88A8E|nr:hypothetical protein [Burkholderia plantarii]ALK35159.1 hypothetical protein bpln_1p0130 [Burkholderia plantarii]GLZ22500.1 hypothetical protein Bpla01_60290 [Burkholderia plantarii]
MYPFRRRARIRPLPYPAHFYRAELRHTRWRMWTSPRLLRIEISWAFRYLARLVVLCWLAWAPALFLWAQLLANRLDLGRPITFVPGDWIRMYVLTGIAVTALWACVQPYVSYIDLQVRRHMNEWQYRFREAQLRAGHFD